MGRGGSDGLTDAKRGEASQAERRAPPIKAEFTDVSHVRGFLESYKAYKTAIDDDDSAAVQIANSMDRPFDHCSHVPVNIKETDNFPFMVNEFVYQVGDRFIEFVNEYCAELEQGTSLAQNAERERYQWSPDGGEPEAKRARTNTQRQY